MRNLSSYKPLSNDDEAKLLGMCMPQGLAWNNKGNVDSYLYKLMKGIATEINAIEGKLYELVTEWDIRVTTELINEWETAVGIPDQCRAAAADIVTRRQDVITKLRKVPIITVADFQVLAESISGLPAASWDIRPGSQDFPNDPLYRFVLLVTAPGESSGAFDYIIGSATGTTQANLDTAAADGKFLFKPDTIFPGYPLSGSFRTDVLQCVFRKVTPANVVPVFD